MLINLRDSDNNLVIKDILDIDFDMSIEEKNKCFFVRINNRYNYSDSYDTRESAEEQMLAISDSRNALEVELRNY